MFTQKRNRRDFIRLASGALAASVGNLATSHARAQSFGQAPLRFLTLIDTYGMPAATRNDIWVRSRNGDYDLQDSDLGTVLDPLRDYRENMLLISDVNQPSGAQGGGEHNIIKNLSGSQALNNFIDAGARIPHPTLDVEIGDFIGSSDYGLASPRLYSHLSFSDYAESDETTFSFDQNGNEIRTLAGARTAANALFGDITSGNVGNNNGTADQAGTGAHLDVLQLVAEQVTNLKGQFSKASYANVLDAYNASVSDLATELQLRLGTSCSLLKGVNSFSNSGSRNGDPSRAERYQMFEVFAQLFACDMVTSIAYNFGSECFNQLKHSFLYDQNQYNDNELRSYLVNNYHQVSHLSSDSANKAHELVRWHQADMLGDFLNTLRVTPDVDGNTVLDNTIVYCSSSFGFNTHRSSDFSLMVIAGKNTNLVGGRHYDCSGNTINDVLSTIGQGAYMSLDSFGGYRLNGSRENNWNNGPITKMLKTTL